MTATGITWDLSDLYDGVEDPRIDKDLKRLKEQSEQFAGTWRGKINSPDLTPKDLATAVAAMEAIYEPLSAAAAFAYLNFAVDQQPPAHGALLTRVREAATDIRADMLFFELEWANLPDETAQPLIDAPELAHYRHYLIKERDYSPHRRTEGEEVILDLKANTGSRAMVRLFDETITRMRVTVDHEGKSREMSEEEALSLLHNPDRELRKAAADGVTAALDAQAPLFTFIFNTLVADHASDDRIRAFSGPMAARNLDNEITQESVDALLSACDRALPTVHDYYRLKRDMMGVDELFDYDRYAPVGEGDKILFDEAKTIVLDSFAAFSPQMADIARMFFDRRWIDAEVRKGKRGGAFSHPVTPSAHPYVMVNYLGTPRDVMTLAHELGHGVHQWLAREKGYFGANTPLTTAETASVFGEMLIFSALRERQTSDDTLLTLLCGKLEDTFATVFRQAVMTRFERDLHKARREEGELATGRIDTLWMAANRAQFGDALTLRDGYAGWWRYIPHFVHTPFYCYAYAYGELLVLSLYARYLEEGDAFVPRYLELLAAGGTDRPEALLKKVGVDITAPDFWDGGMAVLEEWLSEARGAAGK